MTCNATTLLKPEVRQPQRHRPFYRDVIQLVLATGSAAAAMDGLST